MGALIKNRSSVRRVQLLLRRRRNQGSRARDEGSGEKQMVFGGQASSRSQLGSHLVQQPPGHPLLSELARDGACPVSVHQCPSELWVIGVVGTKAVGHTQPAVGRMGLRQLGLRKPALGPLPATNQRPEAAFLLRAPARARLPAEQPEYRCQERPISTDVGSQSKSLA